MNNVTGIFDSRQSAETAVVELVSAGIPQSQISLLLTDNARQKLFIVGRDEAGEAAKGGIVGAVGGGALGAIVLGLTAIGTVAVPGTSLLAVGPMVAALTGTAVGAIAGGLIGALVEAGIPEEEAKRYEQEIMAGKALLVVSPETDTQADIARMAIIDSGATMASAA